MTGNQFAKRASIQQRLDTRAMQTLLGICTGISADATINDKEIIFLKNWLAENHAAREYWPGSAISSRLDTILADEMITNEEHTDLLELLQSITGGNFSDAGSAAPAVPIIPYDDDPSIFFRDKSFCFTGRFFYGTRSSCERVILNLGGTAIDNVSKRLDYLVVGALIEPNWTFTTYGRKIEAAIKHQKSGAELAIVTEQHWTQAIADFARFRS